MSFLNTRDVGPIVIEVPPADTDGSLNANFVDAWQQPLEDAGLLGVDKGKGIKLLMLPPGYSAEIPADYEALQPNTYGAMCCSAPMCKVIVMLMWRSRPLMRSGSKSICSRRRRIHRP